MTTDYKSTVFLPKTEFEMRGASQREPDILAHWEKIDLYRRQREISTGREKFILHDGPPYANGNLHIGHALNKILKDVINRSQQMIGKDANYVPGWDCHGLPIEWKIEKVQIGGTRQGRGADRRVPPGMPGICGSLDQCPAGGIRTPWRDRRLGKPIHDDEFRR